jgi:hypothetical protein
MPPPSQGQALAQLVRQSVLINLLKQAGAERVHHPERAADDSFRQAIRHDLLPIHRHLLTVQPDGDGERLSND